MSSRSHSLFARKPVSLSVRISILLILAAIIPLVIAVASSEFLSRPQLIVQAASEMQSEAQTKVSLIDAYLIERIQNVETVSKAASIQSYLKGTVTDSQVATASLSTGMQLDPNFVNWSLLNPRSGKPLLVYPTFPQLHGNDYIPPDQLTQLQQFNKSLLSNVFFDATNNAATIDIYAPVFTSHLLGVIRATLNIYYIWNIVNQEVAQRGSGSYATIIDENGVRIAYTTPQTNSTYIYSASNTSGYSRPAELFTAIAPLSMQAQQTIKTQDLYGNDSQAVKVQSDATLVQQLRQISTQGTFSLVPANQNTTYQVAAYKSSIMPWTYLIYSPLSTITAIANQQLLYASLIALLVLILAAFIGLGFGRRIAQPIIRSVVSLSANSQSLKTLATKEKNTASEQRWMIESSQVGLQSIRYYTNATNVAAHRLTDVSSQLTQRWRHLDEATIEKYLNEIQSTAKYIETAAERQEESSNNLAAAIRVTTQVTEQLTDGANSAADSSQELELVVNQLRSVVGK